MPPVNLSDPLVKYPAILRPKSYARERAYRLFLFCGPRFRRAVQFNNNDSQYNGGGLAVDGGEVT